MYSSRMTKAGITYVSAMVATGLTVASLPLADAAYCSCLPTSLYKQLGAESLLAVSSWYETVLPQDNLYGFATSTAPYVSVAYNGFTGQSVYSQICRYDWTGTSLGCGAASSAGVGSGSQLIIPSVSGLYSNNNGVWDRYRLKVYTTATPNFVPSQLSQISARMEACG
jgi:hypothetical protein